MGRWVAISPGADPSWSEIGAVWRFYNSVVLGLTATVVVSYAVSGLVFGHLPVFVMTGFFMLHGMPAWLAAAGTLVLAMAWANQLVQWHWSQASADFCRRFRMMCYVAWATAWSVAVVVTVFDAKPWGRWDGLAPTAEWFFAPLPWLWRDLLPLASPHVTSKLYVAGAAAFGLFVVFLKSTWWPRGFPFFLGVAVCVAGLYFLGEAAFDYGAARGLAGASVNFPNELNANPGRYNAWNFLSWWGAVTSMAYGTVLVSCAFVLGPHDLKARTDRS
ncbi:hypothetical protein [Polaromonas sp. JS666]|uniref:hypothetical protein n=1 Tax=Polaromonas sp. (strain JS666 / ATCC BAA-500) TaxID=296591 RepID=UPI000888AA3C|nr:hypothetical protein [Polaromonas sp. JS666]SDN92321.1 hypothetical protein SAMN05720382_11011 [Polaromonas sp. JS666]